VGRLRRPPTEYDLTLRQADQARSDFAVIEDGLGIHHGADVEGAEAQRARLGCGRFLCGGATIATLVNLVLLH
jgi:hypothetical protein